MKIAVAITSDNRVYHSNPCTAPKFSVYNIEKIDTQVTFSLSAVYDNPASGKHAQDFSEEEINCTCDMERQEDFSHACEHYALLEVIGGSSYLLADKYCRNTQRSLRNGGVAIYKVPPMIREVDTAIKNFLLGANYARSVQHIYHAS